MHVFFYITSFISSKRDNTVIRGIRFPRLFTRLSSRFDPRFNQFFLTASLREPQKDFLEPLFKKLGNHSSFYEWNLGSNRSQKMAETSSHFVSLPSRASSELSFHFSGRKTAIKAWNVGREGHQLFQKIMKKDYLWRRKSVPKIFGRSQQR